MTVRPSRRSALGQLVAGPWRVFERCGRWDGPDVLGHGPRRRGRSSPDVHLRAANPGVTVQVQQLPWSGPRQAPDRLRRWLSARRLPDRQYWLPEFVALRAVERLDARVLASSVVKPSDAFGGIWRTNVVDGGLYGVPWYVDTRLLFYRRDLSPGAGFGAPPTTWAQWLSAMQRSSVWSAEGVRRPVAAR